MTKFRFHRGSLADSMATVREVNSLYELITALNDVCEPGKVLIKPYCYDDRIDWDTHIVTIDGRAVGFTDGPLV